MTRSPETLRVDADAALDVIDPSAPSRSIAVR